MEEEKTDNIIWVDRNIQNDENREYQSILKMNYEKILFADSEERVAKTIELYSNYSFVVLSSGQCAYHIVDQVSEPIVIFCSDRNRHFNLFLKQRNIFSVVNQSVYQAKFRVTELFEKKAIMNNLHNLVTPMQTKSKSEYYHSKQYLSIQFLIIMDYQLKVKSIMEDHIYYEIEMLLQSSNQRGKIQQMRQQVKEKEKQLQRKFNLYEIVLFLCTGQDIYKVLNQTFAQYDYLKVRNIFCSLLNGYKQQLQNQKLVGQNNGTIGELYRIIGVDDEIIFKKIIEDFKFSQDNQISIFWNTLSSTTKNKNKILAKCTQNYFQKIWTKFTQNHIYNILFTIQLDQEYPHPSYDLTQFSLYQEDEVLLFPQFEFVVKEIKQSEEQNVQIEVVIKQVRSSVVYVMDEQNYLRNTFWNHLNFQTITPQLKKFIEISSIRIKELCFYLETLQIELNQLQKILNEEIVYFIEQFWENQEWIFNNSVYIDQLKQKKQQFLNILKDDFSFINSGKRHQEIIYKFQQTFEQTKVKLFYNIFSLFSKLILDLEFNENYFKIIKGRYMEMISNQNQQADFPNQSWKIYLKQSYSYKDNISEAYSNLATEYLGIFHPFLNLNCEVQVQLLALMNQQKNFNPVTELLLKNNPTFYNSLPHFQPINNLNQHMEKQYLKIDMEQANSIIKGIFKIISQYTDFSMESLEQGKFDEFQLKDKLLKCGIEIWSVLSINHVKSLILYIFQKLNNRNLISNSSYLRIQNSVQSFLLKLQGNEFLNKMIQGLSFLLKIYTLLSPFVEIIRNQNISLWEKFSKAIIQIGQMSLQEGLKYAASSFIATLQLSWIAGSVLCFLSTYVVCFVGTKIFEKIENYYNLFQIEVSFNSLNKSTYQNDILKHPGIFPQITFKYIPVEAKQLVIYAKTNKKDVCILTNIKPVAKLKINSEKFNQFDQASYLGPSDDSEFVIFKVFALNSSHRINNLEALQIIQNKTQGQLISVAEHKISFQK